MAYVPTKAPLKPLQIRKYIQHTGLGVFEVTEIFDPNTGLGKSIFKKIAKAVTKVVKVVTRPAAVLVRASTAIVAQAVGLKTLAKEIGGNTISKSVLKTAGTIIDVAAIAVGAVVAAPFVATGISAAAGAVGSAASAAAGWVSTAAGNVASALGLKKVAPALLKKAVGLIASGKKAPSHAELTPTEQAQVAEAGLTAAQYDALVTQQQALVARLTNLIRSGQAVPAFTELSADEQSCTNQADYDALIPQLRANVAAERTTDNITPPVTPPVAPPLPLGADPNTWGPKPPITPAIVQPALGPIPSDIQPPISGPGPTYQPSGPGPTTEEQAQATTANPYFSYTEAQLAAEQKAIDDAILYRQSKGLSAGGSFPDMPLIQLYAQRALLMAAYTPILIKKYGLYAAGGLGLILAASMLSHKKK